MTVEAGVTLQEAQEAADAHGLMLPLDLGARGSATIGGNLSTNAGGNRVIRYGMTREMVLEVPLEVTPGIKQETAWLTVHNTKIFLLHLNQNATKSHYLFPYSIEELPLHYAFCLQEILLLLLH